MEVYKKDLSTPQSKKFIELLNSETAKSKIEEGSIVKAEITNITEKFCWVYLGMKSEAMIDIAGFIDERGLKIAMQGRKLIIPVNIQFVADRILNSTLRVGTSDNDINALRNMGMLPDGYTINHYLTDTDAYFIKTDAPNGFKHFVRAALTTGMEGDFDTGNMRYKARERYSFGFSDPRCVYGSQGS